MASHCNDDANAFGKSRRWHPAPAIRFSFLLHAGGVVVWAIQPALWPWIIGVLIANHCVLSCAVLFPKGRLLGPNLTRLPQAAIRRGEVVLTFDDGPDPEVTPRVLDLLDQYQVRASFFCIGAKAAAYPHLLKEILRRGHSVENHSYHHSPYFPFYGIARLRREVQNTQAAIAGITGRAPVFFRAPAGFRSPFLDFVLARCGLHYVSWTRRGFDGVRSDPVLVLRRLTRNLAAGDVLLLHDSVSARTYEPAVLSVLPTLLQQLAAQGLKAVSLPAAFAE